MQEPDIVAVVQAELIGPARLPMPWHLSYAVFDKGTAFEHRLLCTSVINRLCAMFVCSG